MNVLGHAKIIDVNTGGEGSVPTPPYCDLILTDLTITMHFPNKCINKCIINFNSKFI